MESEKVKVHTGKQLIKAIKELGKDLPIVMVGNYGAFTEEAEVSRTFDKDLNREVIEIYADLK